MRPVEAEEVSMSQGPEAGEELVGMKMWKKGNEVQKPEENWDVFKSKPSHRALWAKLHF